MAEPVFFVDEAELTDRLTLVPAENSIGTAGMILCGLPEVWERPVSMDYNARLLFGGVARG